MAEGLKNKDRDAQGDKRNAGPSDQDRVEANETERAKCEAIEKLRQGQSEATMTAPLRRDSTAEVRDAVGRRVRASYCELIQQPVPDKLLQLLDKLQMAEEAAKRRKS